MQLTYAIVMVSDMERSLAFYRDLVGLPVRFSSSHWTELETGAASIALHLADAPATSGPPAPGEGPRAGTCRPGVSVDDIDAFHRRMLEHDVPVVSAPRETFGTRVAVYADPDGMPFGVSQPVSS